MTAPEPARHVFRAMGTEVTLIAGDPSDQRAFARAVRRVESTFGREERRFSRFRPDTELSWVNGRAGRWTKVSAPFAELLRFSLDAAWETAGLFDPTVLPALSAAGYDRDFDEVLAGARGALHPPVPCGRWVEVELDGRLVRLPEGVGLDFGGLAKGWTVDLAAETAWATGELPWVVVNAGGDLRIVGRVPEGGIEVGVEDPEYPEGEATRIRLEAGAIATSSVTKRSWGLGLHHLIDPRTSRPARTGVLQATAWAETCAEAEVRSKWALLDGPLALERMSAVLVMDDGRVVMNLETREPMEVGA